MNEESYISLNQNKWTREKVQNFINLHKIDTGGAISKYPELDIVFEEDGDSWYKVVYPIWRFNKNVVKSILKLANIATDIADTEIYFSNANQLTIYFYVSVCDPD